MKANKTQCEAIKSSISDGTTSTTTVSAFRNILGFNTRPSTSASKTTAISRTTNFKKPATKKAPPRKRIADEKTLQHVRDDAEDLSAKDCCVLATEVVNATLKVLSAACKDKSSSRVVSEPVQPTRSSPTSIQQPDDKPRVLMQTSGNASPKRPRTKPAPTKLPAPSSSQDHISSTVECARLAFSYLKSDNAKGISNAKDQTAWQLDSGVVAFAGKLMVLGLNFAQEVVLLRQALLPKQAVADVYGLSLPEDKSAMIFELQVLSLRLKQMSTKSDVSLEAFHRALEAFRRQSKGGVIRHYELVAYYVELLQMGAAAGSPDLQFEMFRMLASAAEICSKVDGTLSWTVKMQEACSSLGEEHVRHVCCTIKRLRHANDDANVSDLLYRLLYKQTSGRGADYDMLLEELVSYVTRKNAKVSTEMSRAAARYAQRYARSYQDRNSSLVQIIIQTALSSSRKIEDTARWVTLESARIYYRNGTLNQIVDAAARTNMTKAWSTTSEAVTLARILQAILWQAAGLQTDDKTAYMPFEDSDGLTDEEKTVLLHRALYDMPEPKKSRPALPKMLEDVLIALSDLYESCRKPLRRMAVATQVLRLKTVHNLQPHVLEKWTSMEDLRPTRLMSDDALSLYATDVQTTWALARSFHDARPKTLRLVEILGGWRDILNEDNVYDIEITRSQLHACSTYFDVMGDDHNRLLVLRLQQRLGTCSAAVDLAGQYLRLGYVEKSLPLLTEARMLHKAVPQEPIEQLHLALMSAECHVAGHQLPQAEVDLAKSKEIRESFPPERISRAERKPYELLHARAWFVQSKLSLATGSAKAALTAAKRSVKLFQATWASAERATGHRSSQSESQAAEITDPDVPDVKSLTTGVSKLQLTPKDKGEGSFHEKSTKGAAFWPIVSPMCQALMHLSDLYAQHGIYAEADYYSQRAITIAESIPSTHLSARLNVHRSRLLTLAGQLEAAELCLTRAKEASSDPATLDLVDRQCAEAELRTKEGSYEEASQLYHDAGNGIRRIQSQGLFGCFDQPAISPDEMPAVGSESRRPVANRPAKSRTMSSKGASKRSTKAAVTKSSTASAHPGLEPCIILDSFLSRTTSQHAQVLMQMGHYKEASVLVAALPTHVKHSSSQRHYEYRRLMQDAGTVFEADVTYSMLAESTLACPAVLPGEKVMPATQLGAESQAETASTPSQASEILVSARQCLLPKQIEVISLDTATVHRDASLLSDATMYLASLGSMHGRSRVHPARAASQGEFPKMYAHESEQTTVEVDIEAAELSSPFHWPDVPMEEPTVAPLTAAQFQEQYVDILPASWTAISLYLNDECTELYAVRYRAGQSPFLLRLSLARQKPDDEDEVPFDYSKGKTELQDIIAASNYSCHSTKGMEGKGAKSSWWTEREALDRRLHELLLNMENIWFGGFKGIFSQQARHSGLLARFRKSFDDLLLRHLPSRRNAKARDDLPTLDSKVLELFIGLGSDDESTDEPLTDLLYFVVDMLQFSGEHNAYDEIDFDSMVVDVQDALRSYHDAIPRNGEESRHTVLVLDKRLQAFPWESLPCLEDASVSRVGSMLSLRECILSMRAKQSPTGVDHDQYVVNHKSGTYILNPSNDLASTQSTLQEPLAMLSRVNDGRWRSMVQQAPKEEEFKQALTDTSMLLYFGHGAGSQYIRPRTIKKLEKCSEVVWLMGCSSGAITEYGELEPFAVPSAYLMAGGRHKSEETGTKDSHSKCMAVVGTLWDVTDKDIDRFSLAVGEEWGLWPPSDASRLPTKTPKKPQRHLVAPSTPQQVLKTFKTPRVGKTPTAVKTPARSRSRSRPRQDDARKKSLVEAVSRSRDACYLRYLNGAAPVVYGVPVYLGD